LVKKQPGDGLGIVVWLLIEFIPFEIFIGMSTAAQYKNIVHFLLRKYDIKVLKWFKTTNCTAYAFIDHREVMIPEPKSLKAFLFCLHEIGHIITGKKKYNFLMEYHAEMFAITEAMKYGFYSESYVKGAKKYVLDYLKEDLKANRITIDRVPKKVMRFVKKS